MKRLLIIRSHLLSTENESDPYKPETEISEELTLEENIALGWEESSKIKNKDIYLFLGLTKAGKSTSIGYLMGEKVKSRQDGALILTDYDPPNNKKGPKIGHGVKSETMTPAIFKIKEKEFADIELCDTPGFLDNTSEFDPSKKMIMISQAVQLQYVLRTAKSIKVFICVKYSNIEDGANGFRELTSYLEKIFLSPEKLGSNIRWIVTNPPKNQKITSEDIVNTLQRREGVLFNLLEPFQKHTKTIGNIAEVFTSYLRSRNIVDTIKPMMKTILDYFNSNKQQEKLRDPAMKSNLIQAILISHITKENIIPLYFDSGRTKIIKWMKETPSIDQSAFNFFKAKNFESSFKISSLKLVGLHNELRQDLKTAQEQLVIHQENLTTIDRFLQNSDETEKIKQEQAQKLNKIKIEIVDCERRIHLQQIEMRKIDNDDPVPIWKTRFIEQRNEFFKIFGYTDTIIEYPENVPFLYYKPDYDKNKGNLKELENNENAGTLKLRYETRFGEDGDITVMVFCKSRSLPANKKRLEISNMEITQLYDKKKILMEESQALMNNVFSEIEYKNKRSLTLSSIDNLKNKIRTIQSKFESKRRVFVAFQDILRNINFSIQENLLQEFAEQKII